MAEAEVLEMEEAEEEPLPAPEESRVRGVDTMRQDESGSVVQPLLQHKHQHGRDEDDKADTQTATDGVDPETSVPQEPGRAGGDEPGCGGSVMSLRSDGSRQECPICSELLDTRGDHRAAVLHCDHTLCHRCVAGIMRRAKDPGRLQCPFCRQTTPFPQWEIRRLHEESYGGGFYESGPPLVITPGPEPPAASASPFCCFAPERQLEANSHMSTCGGCVFPSCLVGGLRLLRLHSLCLIVTVLLLLFLALLGFLLCMVSPHKVLTIIFNNG